MKREKGMTLIELMVAIAIFSIVIGAALGFLSNLTTKGHQEAAKTKTTQTGMVSELILARDIAMAGLGVPLEVSGSFVPIGSNNNAGQNNSDQLMIKGAVISSSATNYMKWGYNTVYISSGDTAVTVTSGQEDPTTGYPSFPQFEQDDRIVFLNAETKELFKDETNNVYQVYKITDVSGNTLTLDKDTGFEADIKNALAFSLGKISSTDFTDYLSNRFTGYRLCSCDANNICSLCRVYNSSEPILDGVLDFQVQFGLIDATGNITWQNDISAEGSATLKEQLKLARVFILKQYGKRDNSYNYPYASITTADNTVNLTANQRHYRWRTITMDIPLRELQ